MLAPRLNGGRVRKEWQPMSALIWSGPASFCRSFREANRGRSGQPVHKPGGRGGTRARMDRGRNGSSTGGVTGDGGGPAAGDVTVVELGFGCMRAWGNSTLR